MGLSYKEDNRQDVLTDVLRTLRFRSNIFCVSVLSAPWALTLPAGDFAHFHVIERGGGWVQLSGTATSMPLASGDLVVIPHGSGHVLSSDLQTTPAALEQLLQRKSADEQILRYGGGGAETSVVCGAFQFANAAENPLLSILPPLMHIRAGGGQIDRWLEPMLQLLTHEAREARDGSGAMVPTFRTSLSNLSHFGVFQEVVYNLRTMRGDCSARLSHVPQSSLGPSRPCRGDVRRTRHWQRHRPRDLSKPGHARPPRG